ncbi:MAG: hypothetical protein JWN37_786 [Candidatus Nomurabacteria bacterium]|nr:hypothetical protein [Candidatus Nomurabacteria bacterium]
MVRWSRFVRIKRSQDISRDVTCGGKMGIRNDDLRSKVPATLKELQDGKVAGFVPTVVYFLELEHGLMGTFPALFKGTRNVVLTPDLELITDVWKLMTLRKARVSSMHFFLNHELSIAYPAVNELERSESIPNQILTREEFNAVLAADPKPFEWAPGLVGDDMSREEFQRTVEAAKAQCGDAA